MSTNHPNAPAVTKPTAPPRSLAWKLIHSTNSLMTHFSGSRFFPLWAVLEHDGRKSGRRYATPVVARRTSGGFLIPMPFGPGTDWTRNVIAAGGCVIRWKGRRYEVTDPEMVDPDVASSAFGWQRVMFRPVGIEHFLRVRDAGQPAA